MTVLEVRVSLDTIASAVLRLARRRQGLSQVELAAAAGVSQSTVSRAENGRVLAMRVSDVTALADALQVGGTAGLFAGMATAETHLSAMGFVIDVGGLQLGVRQVVSVLEDARVFGGVA